MKLGISAQNKSTLVLKPLDFKLSQLRGINIYIKRLNGHIDGESIVIPIGGVDINNLYSKMKELFVSRFGCKLIAEDSSQAILNDAQSEANRFATFSQKALQIRNNNVEKTELTNFTDSIKDHHFRRTLKPLQLLASYHLAFSQNACNFSVPGAGKTTTVLAAYDYLSSTEDEAKRVDKLLVICPLAAFLAWKDEFEACYGRKPKVLEIRGGVSNKLVEDALMRSNVKEDIIMASYGSVDSKREILTHFLKGNRTMVVLDEAHRIKNVEDGIQSAAALSLAPYAKSRVVLTGTPAANSYVDLYNLYKFIWPANNIIGYSVPQLNTMSKIENDRRVPDLIQRVSPFFIRVKKSDLNLPDPVFHKPNMIPMAPIQNKIYDAIAEMAVRYFEDQTLASAFKKSALIRLRQAATNPNLLNKPLDNYYDDLDGDYIKKTKLKSEIDVSNDVFKAIREYKQHEVPGKFIEAAKLAKQIISDGGKLLIWSEFVGTCKDLSDYLQEEGIKNKILFGATPQEEREATIEEFRKEKSKFNVVIANPHAVGESISLHQACHNALYLEQSFNAGSYMQSKDRIHRLGLAPDVITNYFYFHSKTTIDHRIYSRVIEKESKMLEIIEREDIPLLANNVDYFEDTEDDIKAIIRDYYEQRQLIG